MLKHRFLSATLEFLSVQLGWGTRIRLPNKLRSHADAAGSRDHNLNTIAVESPLHEGKDHESLVTFVKSSLIPDTWKTFNTYLCV